MTAATSGGLGDIVYSIPILRELKVKDILIKENWYYKPHHSLYSSIKSLLIHEGFNPMPIPGGLPEMQYEPSVKFDYDLDSFRKMPGRGRVHIQTLMRRRFKLREKSFGPWLSIDPIKPCDSYSVINLTNRWREGSKVNWQRVLESIPGKVYFVGFQHEWVEFASNYGNIEWFATSDLLEMAHLIAGAEALYCNQSVALTIAQGLGIKYYLEKKPNKTNCLMYTKNENIL